MCWRSRNAIALVLETPGDLPGGKGERAPVRPDDRTERLIS